MIWHFPLLILIDSRGLIKPRNEEKEKSDIDLFIVGEIEESKLHEQLSNIEKEIGREINYTLMTKKEFMERKARGDGFLQRIIGEEKLVLKDNLDVC
ncbi:MAG TPA: nucleotidyltransferase domain-containing protein [Candidatus Saccharicenans sp.]|nr:nucleotidyltransferase domain-containing protein [Candidatus Saccharicenans sp.]